MTAAKFDLRRQHFVNLRRFRVLTLELKKQVKTESGAYNHAEFRMTKAYRGGSQKKTTGHQQINGAININDTSGIIHLLFDLSDYENRGNPWKLKLFLKWMKTICKNIPAWEGFHYEVQ